MSVTQLPPNVATTHLRLRSDGRADQLPVGPDFWPDLMAGKYGDFHHEYLVTCYTFEADWPNKEIHPNGDEIVVLLSGAADFILELPSGEVVVPVREPGQFAFVPKGTWHTANTRVKTTMLFITAGEGTEGKPR